jgi:hypothetical protein
MSEIIVYEFMKLMTPQEVAGMLQISTMGLWKAKERGDISSAAFKRGKNLYDLSEVLRWKKERTRNTKAKELAKRSRERHTRAFRGITDKHRALVERCYD